LKVVITGATGLLGRNFIFELIKRNLEQLDSLDLVILGRADAAGANLATRMREIICSEGAVYMGLDPKQSALLEDFCIQQLRFVPLDLMDIDTGDVAAAIGPGRIDGFFHIAAMLDFRDTDWVTQQLEIANVLGTEHILKIVSTLNVDSFSYVGSAYSCGNSTGLIAPDHGDFSLHFRNPYEISKLKAESLVKRWSEISGVPCYIFRPSTISGRLIEPTLGAIHKFDVFYAWGAFFLRMKLKLLGSPTEHRSKRVSMDVRVLYRPDAGLNIVPADFAAKAMLQAWEHGRPGSYHLVNNQETLHSSYLWMILEAIGVDGLTQVDAIPTELNPLEKIYYKTVGKIYTPYTVSEPMLFDTSNIRPILDQAGLSCPPVDEKNLRILLDYAVQNDFGMSLNEEHPSPRDSAVLNVLQPAIIGIASQLPSEGPAYWPRLDALVNSGNPPALPGRQ